MAERNYIVPPADVFENDDSYVILLDMPGVKKDSIDINDVDDTLSIIAQTETLDEKWKPLSGDVMVSDYKREFTIGNNVDREKIEAHYENGVLTINIGKSEKIKPRKIEVKSV